MNILFYRYGSICEPDLSDAFKEYGLSVYEDSKELSVKNMLPAQRSEHVAKLLFEREYSFVFSINFFPEVSDVCNIFKIPYMCLIVDSPVLELYSDSLMNEWNRIFLFDMELYNEFHPRNPDCIFHIPLATNVRRWDTVMENSRNTPGFSADVSFVGSLYTEKCPYDKIKISNPYNRGYLSGLIEAQLDVYGYYFVENLISDDLVFDIKNDYPGFYRFPEGYHGNEKAVLAQLYIGSKISAEERIRIFTRLASRFNVDLYTGSDTSSIPGIHNKGLAKTHSEMPLIFNRSKINLNITSRPIRSGLPLRIFDVLGCGGFLITNFQSELSDVFNVGEHLVVYESMEDLEYKTAYYLEHEKERREIAHNGYELVKAAHTYEIRVGQMIVTAFGNR